MLTTNKTSRLRRVSGGAAIAVLTLAGLGLTASGTQAAFQVRTEVQRATGVNFAALDPVAALTPQLPSAPRAPRAPAAPPAPDAIAPVAPVEPVEPVGPVAPIAPVPPVRPVAPHFDSDVQVLSIASPQGDGSRRQVYRYVHRDRDGRMIDHVSEMPAVPAMPEVPEVSSRNCPADGDPHQTVINDKKGKKRIIVICTNRIERLAREGAAVAANSAEIERNAYRSALTSLRSARERMQSRSSIREEDRREALEAMDEAIQDLEEKRADRN